MSTHAVEVGAGVVVKRFRAWDQGQHRREWRALTLLAEYAPDLAPRPVRADLEADPPSVTMSRLGGVPLTAPVTPERLARLAEALETAQRALPAHVLAELPFRLLHPREALRSLRRWCVRRPPEPNAGPLVTRAFGAASAWVARPRLDEVFDAELTPVFGLGDGNLANYLWDGSRVRIVDFEYSGRGDRAYELAEAVEHVSGHGVLDGAALLGHFELTAAETVRLRECRRLLALFWFLSLTAEDPAGALTQRAERLLALLET
ncbi:phosphotransferase [Actinomadura sp. DC4]|uniref:phosphotransferase n=1 Tax=Actinomadura sp. DC4 TaxID=3055069 RepID=UPI0025AF8535|nr:phosphotransferase [Actinomadura sp. DC4]MDN3356543.1 phosphotransferase [Actinomadura sp. DC4]